MFSEMKQNAIPNIHIKSFPRHNNCLLCVLFIISRIFLFHHFKMLKDKEL